MLLPTVHVEGDTLAEDPVTARVRTLKERDGLLLPTLLRHGVGRG